LMREWLDKWKDADQVYLIPRTYYQSIRIAVHNNHEAENLIFEHFVSQRISTPLTEERCVQMNPWMKWHKKRIHKLVKLYKNLGYPSVEFLARPGEEEFMRLADCVMKEKDQAFMLSIDYGSIFETLSHSLTVNSKTDGVFIPPTPPKSYDTLPFGLCLDTDRWWQCPGKVDLTSFVDFTNMAAAGVPLGWEPVFYGPQSTLERFTEEVVQGPEAVDYKEFIVPGYAAHNRVQAHSQWRMVRQLYDRIDLEEDIQPWTGFKALVQHKRGKTGQRLTWESLGGVHQSWHLDTAHRQSCWDKDHTLLPLVDWMERSNTTARERLASLSDEVHTELGREMIDSYADTVMAGIAVDYLVKTRSCEGAKNFFIKGANVDELENSVLGTLWGRWQLERLSRILGGILNRFDKKHYGHPPICSAYHTYRALCLPHKDIFTEISVV